MAGAVYKAEFLIIEDKKPNPHNELSNPYKDVETEQDTNEKIIKKKEKAKKDLATGAKSVVSTALGVGTFVYNYKVNEQLTSMSIQGDSIAARNLQNKRTITNDIAQVTGSLAIGLLFPPTLAVTIPSLTLKYITKGIDYSNQLQVYNANTQIDSYLSKLEQDKVQLNSKEFR